MLQVRSNGMEELILETAGRLFAESGSAKTTMRDIAISSTVSTDELGQYFKTKEDLIEKLRAERRDIITEAFKALLNNDLRPALYPYFLFSC